MPLKKLFSFTVFVCLCFVGNVEALNDDAYRTFRQCVVQSDADGVKRCLPEIAGNDELRKVAECGDARAQFVLAYCYDVGLGTEKDTTEAVKWYSKAAEQGDALAQFELGMFYSDGIGVQRDPVKAADWLRKAAQQELPIAQLALGMCYKFGSGVEVDPSEAEKYFTRAVHGAREKTDDASAKYTLGVCYGNGWGGLTKDPQKAIYWLRAAAEQGFPRAQLELAKCYLRGIGLEKNKTEAIRWLRKAAQGGNLKAEKLLKR